MAQEGFMNNRWHVLRRVSFAAAFLTLAVSYGRAQDISKAFTYTTFTVPNAVTLSVESVNDSGTISGYYSDASSDVISFLRASSGTITPYTEPADTTSPTFTEGGQINKKGVVAGEFYDTSLTTYIGYVYKSESGTYETYQVPGEPQYTTNGLIGINDSGAICGFIYPPPYTAETSFIESGGTVTTFSPEGATSDACFALNDSGTSVGYYQDSAGVYHGWMRTSAGDITVLNEPGASTVLGTPPCGTTSVAGTVPLGINSAGYVSGHYWDTSNNEHGFLMTPAGKYYEINVPGAYQSSAGGLNDKVQIVGHYVDSSCNYYGYIATP
jgi:hypothetical protein